MKPKKDEEKQMTDEINKRHVIAVSEDDESVTIKFAKDHDDEEMMRSKDEEKENDYEEEKDMHEDEEEKAGHEEEEKEMTDEEEKEMEEEEEKQDKASAKPLTYRHFSLKSEESEMIDEENRTVKIAFSSEQPYERDFGIEILDHDRANLEFMASGNAPLLLDHDATKQIGIVENARKSQQKLGLS